MMLHSQTITVSPITRTRFEQLYQDHAETLACPCSTIAIPHKNFISSNITLHAVCSSVFVTKQWIEALYLVNASDYGPADFRATAKSQVTNSVQNLLKKKGSIVTSVSLICSFNFWLISVRCR